MTLSDSDLPAAVEEALAPSQVLVVVAGAAGSEPASVLDTLLGAGHDVPLSALAGGPAWTLLRAGARPRASVYVPGRRQVLTIGSDGAGTAGLAGALTESGLPAALGRRRGVLGLVPGCGPSPEPDVRPLATAPDGRPLAAVPDGRPLATAPDGRPLAGQGGVQAIDRPPRRIEIEYPARLLTSVSLAGAPEIGDGDPAGADLVVEALGGAVGLVFVTTEAPFETSQLDLLRRAAARVDRFAFVHLARGDDLGRGHPVAAKRSLLTAYAPALANAGWFADGAASPGIGDLDDLRRTLVEWGAAATVAGRLPHPRPAGRGAPQVPAADDRWRLVLDRGVDARLAAAYRQVTADLGAVRTRCGRELSAGRGCYDLPAVLDRELHALSVRMTGRLAVDARAVAGEVCSVLLDAVPDDAVLARVVTVTREIIESWDETAPDHALLLTTTAGVATLAGLAAVEGLGSLWPVAGGHAPLAPVGVAVGSGCYQRWQQRDPQGVERCRAWLGQALGVVETELRRELEQRYRELRHGLTVVATEAVDHGFLLV